MLKISLAHKSHSLHVPEENTTYMRVMHVAHDSLSHRDLGQGHGGVDWEVGGAGCHAGFDQVHAEHGDHGTVVGAELDLRDADVDTVILAEFE